MRRGFQLVEPLAHCSSCNQPFSEKDIRHWRAEFGAGDDPDVDEEAQVLPLRVDEDFPDVCHECAEIEHMHDRQLRAAE